MMHCMSEPQALRDASHVFCSFLIAFTASACADLRSGEYSRASCSSSALKVGSPHTAVSTGSFASLQSNEAAVAGLTTSSAATAIRTVRNIVGSPVVGLTLPQIRPPDSTLATKKISVVAPVPGGKIGRSAQSIPAFATMTTVRLHPGRREWEGRQFMLTTAEPVS